jgi:molecular chaperone HtpG
MTVSFETFEFQAETRQLLDLMIHSLYSNKEIFLRELISNASDALDRLRFEALTAPELLEQGGALEIRLSADPAARTLTVADTGIGMSREELVSNIGTIARSGTRELIAKVREGKTEQIPPEFIGQFGVGFYSAFMVADRITLVTRRAGEERATRWESTGDGTYRIEAGEKSSRGTSITLELKPVDTENGIDDFTSEYVLARIVKQYSDFVPYPVKLKVEREEPERDETGKTKSDGKKTIVIEDRTLNSMKALWSKSRTEATDDEYKEFYRHIAHDWNEPRRVLTQHAEGTVAYDALLYIPSVAPHELYYQAYRSGLGLYVRKVRILEHCEDLLPRYLRFVKGVVECSDLPLNVSREMLQRTREIQQIRKGLTKKVLDCLAEMKEKEPESYLEFWSGFGRAMKEAIGTDYDNRDRVLKLLLFQSSNDPVKLTTLDEYLGRMKEEQKDIFYITGESRVLVENLPHLEALKEKGYEVLYLVEPTDELLVQHLFDYEGKKLKSAGKGELNLGDAKEKEEAKKEREEQEKQHADLLSFIQKTLDEHVKHVRLSSRLTSFPACLVGAEHDYSPQLEKLLLKGKGGGPKQRRILEINSKHPIFELMQRRFDRNPADPELAECAQLLFGQALLTEGSELPDPVMFSQMVAKFMVTRLESESRDEAGRSGSEDVEAGSR